MDMPAHIRRYPRLSVLSMEDRGLNDIRRMVQNKMMNDNAKHPQADPERR